MIKAVVNGSSGPVMVFGLSDLNVRRLCDGDPILFDLGELGYELKPVPKKDRGMPTGQKVLIVHGKDEQILCRRLGLPDFGPPESGKQTRVYFDAKDACHGCGLMLSPMGIAMGAPPWCGDCMRKGLHNA